MGAERGRNQRASPGLLCSWDEIWSSWSLSLQEHPELSCTIMRGSEPVAEGVRGWWGAQPQGNLKPNHCPKPQENLPCSEMSYVRALRRESMVTDGAPHLQRNENSCGRWAVGAWGVQGSKGQELKWQCITSSPVSPARDKPIIKAQRDVSWRQFHLLRLFLVVGVRIPLVKACHPPIAPKQPPSWVVSGGICILSPLRYAQPYVVLWLG